jgi:tight adherence protein C
MNIQRTLLAIGLNVEDAIVILAGASAFISVWAVWRALLDHSPMQKRAKELRQRQKDLAAGFTRPRRHALRRAAAVTTMRNVMARLKLLQSKKAGDVAEQLSRCGWRSKDAVTVFVFLRIACPFAFLVLALVLMPLVPAKISELNRTLLPLLAAGIGIYVPGLVVKSAIKQRENVIQKALPDALDLLVICAEAGLSLDAALTRIGQEIGHACPQLADEVGLTAVELGFLPDRRTALQNLTRRCHLASLRGVVNTLQQTEKYGTPLSNALRVLSAEFRHERLMKAEEKAARLPVILTVPMIIFILPALLIVLIGPAGIRVMDALKNLH